MTEPSTPPTRWELTVVGQKWQWYVDRFDRLHRDGADLDGEARFVDMMAARGSTVLDGGCGPGRVSGALHRMGHRVVGVDRDAGLVAVARDRYPGPSYLVCDLLLVPAALAAAGEPSAFDIVALPGNVMVYLAPGTERDVLAVAHRLLKPGAGSSPGSRPIGSTASTHWTPMRRPSGWSASTGSPPGTWTRGAATPTGPSRCCAGRSRRGRTDRCAAGARPVR